MKIVNIHFINFWNGFNSEQFFTNWKKVYYHPEIIWTHNKKSDPDVLISSVFGQTNHIKKFRCYKILYSRENLKQNFNHFYKAKHLFDLVIDFIDIDNTINIPYYYELIKEYNIDINNYKPSISNRYKNICLVSRNPQKLRLLLLKSFESIGVDCPSRVGKNMTVSLPTEESKINFLSNYYFNICPENSYCEGYTTEKLFHCSIAGCIPIYYGCEQLNNKFYNPNRILHIKYDLNNYEQIVHEVYDLITNRTKLIDKLHLNPFCKNVEEYLKPVENKIITHLTKILDTL